MRQVSRLGIPVVRCLCLLTPVSSSRARPGGAIHFAVPLDSEHH